MNAKYRLLILSIFIVLIIWKTSQYYNSVEGDGSAGKLHLQTSEPLKPDMPESIKVTVYYEALCSDSRNFVLKHLLPTYSQFPDRMTLDLVPYGKAKTIETNDGDIDFECQHTKVECLGNKVHACVVDLVADPMVQLKMVACMIDDGSLPLEVAERCAHENGVSYDQIMTCTNSLHSSLLLKTHGVRTKAVQPAISFIPTIELDGTQRVPLPKLLKDFKKELCNNYRDVPKGCLAR